MSQPVAVGRTSPGVDSAAAAASSSSSDDAPAMVVARARRPNAGNWMRKLLDQEARPDEQQDAHEFYSNEHWAEDPDDDEFGGAAAIAPEDVALESSGDEDEGEGGDGDDDDERALRREERQEKLTQKRKRKDPFAQAALRQKKPKAATASMPPPPRPKRRSERVSWLPETTGEPVRSSSRRLTVQSKQSLALGLQEKERHRLHVLEAMKKAEGRKEKDPRRPMTQESRLAEAARVEKRNSKTLSRWEESERLKAEENKARLEALKNRKLDGPFIRYYSGPSVWVDGKLKHVGKDGCEMRDLDTAGLPTSTMQRLMQADEHQDHQSDLAHIHPAHAHPSGAQLLNHTALTAEIVPTSTSSQPTGPLDVLNGTSMDTNNTNLAHPQSTSSTSAQAHVLGKAPTPDPPQQAQPQLAVSSPPQVVLLAARNLVTLHNFSALRPRDRDALSRALFKWPAGVSISLPTRPAPGRGARNAHLPHRELCSITAQPARYRDPLTGLPYADAFAFKSIHSFVNSLSQGNEGPARWSNLLGCFVGPKPTGGGFTAAKGVPARFLGNKRAVVVEHEKTEAVPDLEDTQHLVVIEGKST